VLDVGFDERMVGLQPLEESRLRAVHSIDDIRDVNLTASRWIERLGRRGRGNGRQRDEQNDGTRTPHGETSM
jgi:hypothetical protein